MDRVYIYIYSVREICNVMESFWHWNIIRLWGWPECLHNSMAHQVYSCKDSQGLNGSRWASVGLSEPKCASMGFNATFVVQLAKCVLVARCHGLVVSCCELSLEVGQVFGDCVLTNTNARLCKKKWQMVAKFQWQSVPQECNRISYDRSLSIQGLAEPCIN